MNYPLVRGTNQNTLILAQDYHYDIFCVPEGYETNGSDIPRLFWSWSPPFKPKYLPAVIIHDYLCDEKLYNLADDTFEEILMQIENSFKTRMMIRAVKLYTKWIR